MYGGVGGGGRKADPYSDCPQPVYRPVPGPSGEPRQIVRWVRREHWSAQLVVAPAAVAVAAVVFVVGLLVGAGLAPFVTAWLA
jgi:hypothetical protein